MAPGGPRVFVISSPSGGGKTTAVEGLLGRMPGLFRSVSATTRAPRQGERASEDYLFLSQERFEEMRRSGELLEWAQVHGALYGTPKAPVLDALAAGRHAVLCIDVQGAKRVREILGDEAVLVFLMPPTLDVLRGRLEKRGTETAEALERRLAIAEEEIACAAWYDHTLVNEDIEGTVEALARLIERYGPTKEAV